MRRWILVVVLAAGFAAIAYALLGSGDTRRPRPLPEQEDAPEPRPAALNTPLAPEATTGTLVVRVRLPDGASLPVGAQAGYRRFGQKNLRTAASDGSFRFSDVPVGTLEAIADVEGYEGEGVTVVLVPGLPTEAVVPLHRILTPPK